MPTAIHPNSKSCTKLLLDSEVAASLAVDLSSERTNLTNNTTYLTEANSARTAIYAPRSISVVLDMRSTDSRPIVHHGSAANTYSYRINVTSGQVIQCSENATLLVSATMPGMSATARRCLIHWAQRIEGATVISELMLYNTFTEEYAFARASHALTTPVGTNTLTIGASFVGAQLYTGGLAAIHAVRIGQRYVSTTEAINDFVAASTPPTVTGLRRYPLLTGDHEDLRIASDGEFAGPSYLIAGAATRQASHRQVGPLVNIRYNNPNLEFVERSPANWYRITPDSKAGWFWNIRYLAHGELSNQVNFAHVRAHVRVGLDFSGPDCSPVSFKAFSFAHLPTGALNEPKMIYYPSEVVTFTEPTGSDGYWLDFHVRLAREPNGRSYVTLAFKVDPTEDEGVEYDTVWTLNALTVDPYSKDISGGGFGGDIEGFSE